MSYIVLPDGTLEPISNIREECGKEEPTILDIVAKCRDIYDEFRN